MTVPLIIPPTSPFLSDPKAVILDASWLYQPEPPTRNAYDEFKAGPRFHGARWWDLEDVSEPHPDGYVLMLPSPERFAGFAGEHGIEKDSHVIVYDGEGVFAAPRTAWTFKVYGHQKVSVIDGGLPRAIKEGVKLETGSPKPFKRTEYPIPTAISDAVVEFDEIVRLASRTSTSEGGTLLIDARPTGSYEDGHIPTALLLDFPTTLLRDPAGFTYLRDPEDLKRHIATQLGVDILNSVMNGDATVVNSWSLSIPQLSADAASACGGGLSAAINWLHLQSLGIDSRLYDESWGGYSARPETVRITGSDTL